jgi:glycosyltransferase involved in cell wall biosynthesis
VRIALALGWYLPDSTGGTEMYVKALAQAFTSGGHDVAITAPRRGLSAPDETVVGGQRVFRYPVPDAPTRDEARGVTRARGAAHLDRWLERFQPDILHVHSLVTGLGLEELARAKARGSRLVYTNHLPSMGFVCARGTLMQWGTTPCDGVRRAARCGACLLQQRGVPRRLAQLGTALEPRWMSRAAESWPGRVSTGLALPAIVERNGERQQRLFSLVDRVVVLSQSAADILRANGIDERQLVINRLGVAGDATARPARPHPAGPVTIGYVGRYDWAKGLAVMARAITMVPTPALRFTFRGPTHSAQEQQVMLDLQARLASDARVAFEPAVSADEIARVLARLDVLASPSVTYENGPTVALEALRVGTPVIGTRVGAFPENVLDEVEGCLIPPDDAGALARVFERIAADRSVLDTWRAGIRPVRTMTHCAEEYLSLFHDLVGEPCRA